MARNRENTVEAETDEGTTQLVFEAPPTISRSQEKNGKWEQTLAPLREHPDQWVRVTPEPTENPNSLANFLKSGKAKGVDERFDFVSRTTDTQETEDGKTKTLGHVYAIFLSDENLAVKQEYERIGKERREAIRQAKEQGVELDRSTLPDLPERPYMP